VAGLANHEGRYEVLTQWVYLFHKVEFGNMEGYDDIKGLVRHALDSDETGRGPPAGQKIILAWNSGKDE
jgi:hypothetical protein